jgi:hypothetical protein
MTAACIGSWQVGGTVPIQVAGNKTECGVRMVGGGGGGGIESRVGSLLLIELINWWV